MTEGKRQEQIEQVRRDLAAAQSKLAGLEARVNAGDVAVVEMRTDIKHILSAVGRLESKIDALQGEPK